MNLEKILSIFDYIFFGFLLGIIITSLFGKNTIQEKIFNIIFILALARCYYAICIHRPINYYNVQQATFTLPEEEVKERLPNYNNKTEGKNENTN